MSVGLVIVDQESSIPGREDDAVIQFEHVAKRYPDGTDAVEDFSLTLPSGTATVLVGSSGCGKTTLLRMINRMVQPTGGRILIDDEDVASANPVALRRRIGYVMQESGLLPHRRVIDNITTVPRLNGVSKTKAEARGRELMALVGLDEKLARRFPSQLSGGQQQRVGVARALASDPNILLMDEPFGAVDPIVRRDLQRELLSLQARLHKTIVFVTHDIDEAFLLGDQVAILQRGGRLAQVGTARELMSHPASPFVRDFLGLGSAETALHVEATAQGPLVVDATGRPLGVLSQDSA